MSDGGLFFRAARLLWGERWQSDAARQLRISDRHIRRMVSGEAAVPSGIYVDMMQLILEHQGELDNVVEELKRHGAG